MSTHARGSYYAPWRFVPPGDWADDAECRKQQYNPDWWFNEHPARAIRICRECPVQAECYDYAAAHGEVYGVWAGRVFGGRADKTRTRRRREQSEAS